MYTDLFRALKNPCNPRGHPLLAGLLYAFCPAAAKWWLAGAEPIIPFDPVWQALIDHTEEKACDQALIEYGFESELERGEQFLIHVEELRQSFENARAPEATPLFNLDEPDASERFGIQSAIDKFGGNFMNFYSYVRARYFLIQDWKANSGASEKVVVEFKNIPVHFTAKVVRKPVQWETWTMVAETGNVSRYQVGLLTNGLEQDAVRFSLAHLAVPIDVHRQPVFLAPVYSAWEGSNAAEACSNVTVLGGYCLCLGPLVRTGTCCVVDLELHADASVWDNCSTSGKDTGLEVNGAIDSRMRVTRVYRYNN